MTIKHISPRRARRRAGRPLRLGRNLGRGPFEHKGHQASSQGSTGTLRGQLAQMRVATAPYATDLGQAKADGYRIITPNMEDMGFHYLNPGISDFDVTKPPILVYTRPRRRSTSSSRSSGCSRRSPRSRRSRARQYGSFPAACHYDDGTFTPASSEDDCAPTSPRRDAVRLLASEARDPARLDLVPEPRRPLQPHQPARQAVQRRVNTPHDDRRRRHVHEHQRADGGGVALVADRERRRQRDDERDGGHDDEGAVAPDQRVDGRRRRPRRSASRRSRRAARCARSRPGCRTAPSATRWTITLTTTAATAAIAVRATQVTQGCGAPRRRRRARASTAAGSQYERWRRVQRRPCRRSAVLA